MSRVPSGAQVYNARPSKTVPPEPTLLDIPAGEGKAGDGEEATMRGRAGSRRGLAGVLSAKSLFSIPSFGSVGSIASILSIGGAGSDPRTESEGDET